MRFAPKTDKELAELNLLPEAIYGFEVLTAENKQSKKGNDMIELELLVYKPDGNTVKLKDWIMEKMAHKLSAFCKVTGLTAQYNSGNLTAEDCLGRGGYAEIVIQPGKKKDNSEEFFPDRNSVKNYHATINGKSAGDVAVSAKPQPAEKQLANQDAEIDDQSVPF